MRTLSVNSLCIPFLRDAPLSALLSFVLALGCLSSHGQASRTFTIEDLKGPGDVLPSSYSGIIWQDLILADRKLSRFDLRTMDIPDPYAIVAKGRLPDSLVGFGFHPFFNGMYQAYADHRPFTLSPDMIWLLVSQGFARHVTANAEALRSQFVSFSGKETLIVRDDRIVLEDPNSPWEEVFPQFTQQIGERTGKELIKTLTSDFTTTTPVTRVASEITIMEAVKPYFDFIVLRIVCGIPRITLLGTPEDWEKVRKKARQLRKYQLDWWIDELDPLLQQFVDAARGKVDKEFWRNMFKYHSEQKYGAPKIIDGWIVKFFPYDKTGKRTNLKEITGTDNLPNEMAKVDLRYIVVRQGATADIPDGAATTTPLELWAGFVGLRQDRKSLGLTPEIGWMIRRKDTTDEVLRQLLEKKNTGPYAGIQIRVKEVPREILGMSHIQFLELNFIDDINIPDALQQVTIDKMNLRGKINEAGINRIRNMFPHTDLSINEQIFQRSHQPALPMPTHIK